jgi:hypothetical protein
MSFSITSYFAGYYREYSECIEKLVGKAETHNKIAGKERNTESNLARGAPSRTTQTKQLNFRVPHCRPTPGSRECGTRSFNYNGKPRSQSTSTSTTAVVSSGVAMHRSHPHRTRAIPSRNCGPPGNENAKRASDLVVPCECQLSTRGRCYGDASEIKVVVIPLGALRDAGCRMVWPQRN